MVIQAAVEVLLTDSQLAQLQNLCADTRSTAEQDREWAWRGLANIELWESAKKSPGVEAAELEEELALLTDLARIRVR